MTEVKASDATNQQEPQQDEFEAQDQPTPKPGSSTSTIVTSAIIALLISLVVVEFGGVSGLSNMLTGNKPEDPKAAMAIALNEAQTENAIAFAELGEKIRFNQRGSEAELNALASQVAAAEDRFELAQSGTEEVTARLDSLMATIDPQNALAGKIAGEFGETMSVLDARLTEVAAQAQRAQDLAIESDSRQTVTLLSGRIDELLVLVEDLTAERDTLATQVAAMESQQGALVDDTVTLAAALAEAQANIDPNYVENRNDAVRLLAISKLNASLEQSRSFGAELDTLAAIADAELAKTAEALAPIAGLETPTFDQLRAASDDVWRDLDILSKTATDDGSLADTFLGRLQSIVSVKPLDARGQENLAGWLADAEAALEVGETGPDLATFYAKIQRIPGDLKDRSQVYQDWLARVENRITRYQGARALEAWTLASAQN